MPGVDKPRVFIIDDERPIGRVINLGLGNARGGRRFEIIWDTDCPKCDGAGCSECEDEHGAQTGRVPYGKYPHLALERLLTDELFDVVFLDIGMPDLNGMMFYEVLRTHAPARCSRVVFITGGGLIPAIHDFIEKHHTIEKPFSFFDLEACVDVYAELSVSRGPR